MRSNWSPRRVRLLAAIALLLPAAPALAARAPALVWPGPEVAAGQVVELSWSDVPAGIEELEILLSLDDGRTYGVRVSPELDGRERRYRWRVPNLPAAHARLRLRLGSEHAEIAAEPTPSFRIAGAAGAPAPGNLVHEGTCWTGLETPGSGVAGPDAFAPATRLRASDPTGAAAEAPPRSAVEPPARGLAVTDTVEPQSGLTSPPVRRGGGPEFFPQRS